jgi:L-fuculose-phosphate aldolase
VPLSRVRLINTVSLGQALARCLGQVSVVLMKNHCITFVGRTLEEATMFGICMERACRSQIEMAATGWNWTTPTEAGYDRKMSGGVAGTNYHVQFFEYFARALAHMEGNRARN